MLEPLKNEPVRIGAIVTALLGALASYGLRITPELTALLVALVPLLVAELVRGKTTGPVTAANLRAELIAAKAEK